MKDAVLPVGALIIWCIVAESKLVNEVFYAQDWDVYEKEVEEDE